jgi:antitoxin (DNA-binding transcriptional repressor) of toxin-antitoxin stability system
MKEINVREMRESLGRLDEILSETGEVIVSRRGQPIARLLPMPGKRPRPDHADLRARMPRLTKTSEALIRSERDER